MTLKTKGLVIGLIFTVKKLFVEQGNGQLHRSYVCVCVCVFQTVHSEQPLSEEGGAKLHISSAVLEESRRIIEAAEGLILI